MARILRYIERHDGVSRSEINQFIEATYDGSLTAEQLYNRISYALKRLRKGGYVDVIGHHNSLTYVVSGDKK